MKTIYKHKLESKFCKIKAPEDSHSLHVNVIDDEIYVWMQTDTQSKPSTFTFKIYATGEPHEDEEKELYIGTVIVKDNVWHVYELIENFGIWPPINVELT